MCVCVCVCVYVGGTRGREKGNWLTKKRMWQQKIYMWCERHIFGAENRMTQSDLDSSSEINVDNMQN